MVSSGENKPRILEEFNGYVLGLPWKPEDDLISMHMGVNLSAKKQKVRLGEEITLDTMDVIDNVLLTRRQMISQIYSLFDPLGLLSPITIKYKLLLQQLVQSGIGWDDPLPPEVQKTAKSVLREIVENSDVSFHRSVVPAGAQGKPQLVGFWDGGRPASAACLYVRTVEVQLGNKKPTKRNQPAKDLVTAVQRLVLLVPADELEQGPPEP